MSRNRVIYQSESLYVGPTPSTGQHFSAGNTGSNLIKELFRIQSINDGNQLNRTDINQFGELGAIDRPILDTPIVNLEFSYILANFVNEQRLGLVCDGTVSCLSGILNKTADEKNYFIKTVSEGEDSIGSVNTNPAQVGVKGIGNGFLSSYSTQASVGNFATVDVRVEALNMIFANGVSGDIPAVNPTSGTRITTWKYTIPTASSNAGTGDLQISALRPGDITIMFRKRDANEEGIISIPTGEYDSPGADIDEANIQSYSLSFDLSREAIQKLGSRFAFSREIRFPVNISLSVDALAAAINTGSLSDAINCDSSYDVIINLYKPIGCDDDERKIMCQYHLKNAKINSQSSTASIGSNKMVKLDFSAQMGGPNQANIGLFMSGDFTE